MTRHEMLAALAALGGDPVEDLPRLAALRERCRALRPTGEARHRIAAELLVRALQEDERLGAFRQEIDAGPARLAALRDGAELRGAELEAAVRTGRLAESFLQLRNECLEALLEFRRLP